MNRPPTVEEATATVTDGITSTLLHFVEELRTIGVPVSVAEGLDALRAFQHVPMTEREAFKSALGATLVKNAAHYSAFETVFEIFFATTPAETVGEDSVAQRLPDEMQAGEQGAAGQAGGEADIEAIVASLMEAMLGGDDAQMRALAALAVGRFAGMEAGRPVGGTYYLYKTLRSVDLESLLERVLASERARLGAEAEAELTALEERLLREEFEARVTRFRELVKDEIRRRLVEDRGAEALARSLRKPLLEEVDFMHATSQEMKDLRRAIAPLARRLAVRLALRRRHKRGRLDVRKTMRESLSTGGVPLTPHFRHPRPHKPEIFLLCDISGSVASFARFTMQLTYAMQQQFSKVRSWVFIDDIDEVTRHFENADDIGQALVDVNTNAKVVWIDGHSDYGHALKRFGERWGEEVTSKSVVIITGDARNNYHASEVGILADIEARARRVYWLNPEPLGYWDTGDSVIGEYATHCESVHEVRNLKQLERFVESLVTNA